MEPEKRGEPGGWMVEGGLSGHGLLDFVREYEITRDQIIAITEGQQGYSLIYDPTPEQRQRRNTRNEGVADAWKRTIDEGPQQIR